MTDKTAPITLFDIADDKAARLTLGGMVAAPTDVENEKPKKAESAAPTATPAHAEPPQKATTKTPSRKTTRSRRRWKPESPVKSPVQSTELGELKANIPEVQSTELATKSLPFGHPDRDDNESVLVRLSVDDIIANDRFRARGELDIDEIAQSLKLNGQLQPVHVRTVAHDDGSVGYELICGYRRFGGAKALGWEHLNALVVDATDEQAAAMSLVENHARKETSKTDVARGLLLLRETTGKKLEEVAESHGLGKTQAFAYAGILKMPNALQEAIGNIEHGCELEHAKVLHKTAKDGEWNEGKLSEWIARVEAETLSVRDLREKLASDAGKPTSGEQKAKLKKTLKGLRSTLSGTAKALSREKTLADVASVMTAKQRATEAERCADAIAAIERYRGLSSEGMPTPTPRGAK